MPRPQFSLNTLLCLMALVGAFAWTWAHMDPIPFVAVHSMRGKLALCDLTRTIMKGAWMSNSSRRMCTRGESRSID